MLMAAGTKEVAAQPWQNLLRHTVPMVTQQQDDLPLLLIQAHIQLQQAFCIATIFEKVVQQIDSALASRCDSAMTQPSQSQWVCNCTPRSTK